MANVTEDHSAVVENLKPLSDAPSPSEPNRDDPAGQDMHIGQQEAHVDDEKTDDVSAEAQSPPSSPLKVLKPSRKTTVVQLRAALSAIGLETSGKKDTIYKRLLKAFYRSEEPDPSLSERSEPDRPIPKPYEERLAEAQEDWKAFLCFDVEATCRGTREFDWPNEIIEFPVVLLKWVDVPSESDPDTHEDGSIPRPKKKRLERVDTFHTYVRPVWSPVLTQYCTSLTGITQEMVDNSPSFPEVLKLLETWLDKHDLREEDGRLKDAAWVTDGPWDLRDFIPKQLHITPTDPPRPPYLFGQYLNIKQATQTVLCELWRARQTQSDMPSRVATPVSASTSTVSPAERASEQNTSEDQSVTDDKTETIPTVGEPVTKPVDIITTHKTMSKALREGRWKGPKYYFSITGQVEALGLGDFTGRQHSGLDDAINISRILIALSEKDRVIIEPNARTPHPNHMKNWPWMGKTPGVVKFEEWMSRGSGMNPYSDAPPPNGVVAGEDTKKEDTVAGEEEEMVWDLKEDAAGAMRAVKVPLSEATGATQKIVEQKKAAQREDEAETVRQLDHKPADAEDSSEAKGQQSSPNLQNVHGCEDQLATEDAIKTDRRE